MDMTKKYSGVVGAAKDFFGLLSDQSLQDFAAEWRKLSDADKEEIKAGLKKLGYMIEEANR